MFENRTLPFLFTPSLRQVWVLAPSNHLSQIHSDITQERETILTNSFKKQRKQSPLVAVALLSVLLGAQTAVFAGINIGNTPYSYNFGFNIGANSVHARLSAQATAANIFNGCMGAFGGGVGFNECVYGGKMGVKAAALGD